MGTLTTWISIALLGLIQAKGILSLDVKSCNASECHVTDASKKNISTSNSYVKKFAHNNYFVETSASNVWA